MIARLDENYADDKKGKRPAAPRERNSFINSGKVHLDEGIKVLKTGDTRGALMHLHISDKILSGITSSSAQTGRMHLDEGIKVLKTGDIKGALMHLHISDKILGGGGYSG